MPSEHRLHPLSILFSLGGQLASFAVPLLFLLVGASSAGWEWQKWLLPLLIPYTAHAVGHYMRYRYRYDAHELVVRSGLIFRNERHVPYARIQSIDAVRNVFHRMLGVVEVRVQTGSGSEPEATMSVLPLAAYEEMRERVFLGGGAGSAAGTDALVGKLAGEHAAAASGTHGSVTADIGAPADAGSGSADAPPRAFAPRAAPAEPEVTLLALSPGEVMLSGLVENRGFVVIAAVFGLIWELDLWEGMNSLFFSGEAAGGGVARDLGRALFSGGEMPWERLALSVLAFGAFLLGVRVLSMGLALVRLHGFRLSRGPAGLKTEYGLFTRVVATIPLHRIQALTIREGPLHRVLGRVAVRVDTAGGGGDNEDGSNQREWLAPILPRRALPALLAEVVPGVALESLEWQPPAPRAIRRAFRAWLVVAVLVGGALAVPLGWRALGVFALIAAWGRLDAARSIARQGWALTDGVIAFRSGWIGRRLSVARLDKIQAVTLSESPFDRRYAMASVCVDTAGVGLASHRVDIPYLTRTAAAGLADTLAARAARIAFRW